MVAFHEKPFHKGFRGNSKRLYHFDKWTESKAIKTQLIRLRVRVGGLTEGNPPMLAFSKLLTRPDGKTKLHSQMTQVTDTALLAQVRCEANNGVEADIVRETRLSCEEVSTIVKEFVQVQPAVTD